MKTLALVPLVVCLLAGAAARAADDPKTDAGAKSAPAVEASIPFADHDGIYTWQVENNRTVLIQSQSRKWYRATLMSPCFDLPFAEQIAFETNPSGSFDKFSAIRVRSQRCPVTSLVQTNAPVKPAKKLKSPPKPTPAAVTH